MKNRQNIYKIATIVFILDQWIKLMISHMMQEYDKITVIPNFFSIQYVKNKGAAFSILEDKSLLLIIISIVFILVLDKMIKKEKNFTKLSILSLGMIIGGVFGNLMDRILYHSVIDYLSFIIINYHFPVFNLADIGITVGTFLLLITMIFDKKEKDDKKRSNEV